MIKHLYEIRSLREIEKEESIKDITIRLDSSRINYQNLLLWYR